MDSDLDKLDIGKVLSPLLDVVFKFLFTKKELGICLRSLLSSLLGRDSAAVKILSNELPVDDVSQINERHDIICLLDGEILVDLEIEAFRKTGMSDDNLLPRILYYLDRLYTNQNIKGRQYKFLLKAYHITIFNFSVLDSIIGYKEKFLYKGEISNLIKTEHNSFIIIDMTNLSDAVKKPVKNMTSLEMWLVFLKYANDPQYRSIINQIDLAKGEIKMAHQALLDLSQDDRERARLLSISKFQMDYDSHVSAEIELAEKRGAEQATQKSQHEIIAHMRSEGLDDEKIAKLSGLPMDIVKTA
ncbi:MAG: Rpn family recombination-promoting nuclease/putative transposase [Deltaproteobacteria bacterium]|nr:Rpn family recombination-promoting nuclease/putative transposase [Deltaproteobacteria bacterium]